MLVNSKTAFFTVNVSPRRAAVGSKTVPFFYRSISVLFPFHRSRTVNLHYKPRSVVASLYIYTRDVISLEHDLVARR